MGKIQTAIRRAQERNAKKRDGRRESPIPEIDDDPLEPSTIWNELAEFSPDADTMASYRLIEGSEQYYGAAMAFNMLRTRMIKRMRDNKWRSVVVTSPDTGAGKTVTALNLAFSVAREQNQRTYIIDLDFRVPSLHRYLGVTPARDLTNYLDGECTVSDVISVAGFERLYFGFNTVDHAHSAELLSSPRMHRFVNELREHDPNAMVIYDAPPMLVADDVLAFSPFADAVLLVVAEGQTSRNDLKKAIDLLSDVNVLGVVLNKSRDVLGESYY